MRSERRAVKSFGEDGEEVRRRLGKHIVRRVEQRREPGVARLRLQMAKQVTNAAVVAAGIHAVLNEYGRAVVTIERPCHVVPLRCPTRSQFPTERRRQYRRQQDGDQKTGKRFWGPLQHPVILPEPRGPRIPIGNADDVHPETRGRSRCISAMNPRRTARS